MRPSPTLFPYFVLDTSTLDGLATLAPETVLTDITSDVRWVNIRRGKMRETDRVTPGICQLGLNNASRKYDPTNTASIYYGNIAPMRLLYITAVVAGTDYPLYRGYIQEWTVDYADQNLPLAGIVAADCLSLLARQDLATIAAAHSGDLPGARISRILNLSEVSFPTDLRSIATGRVTMGDTTFGANALTSVEKVADADAGNLYASKLNVLTFEEGSTAPGASVATFSDDGAASSIPYLTIDQANSRDLLYNRVVASGVSGTEQIATDAISIADNQVSNLDRTGLPALNDADLATLAAYLRGRYSTPDVRLRSCRVAVDSLAAARQAEILGLEITDRVTVARTPPGGGTPASITQSAAVAGLEWNIAAGGTGWACTATFQSGSRVFPLVLDDATLGLLDTAFLGA